MKGGRKRRFFCEKNLEKDLKSRFKMIMIRIVISTSKG
jgi:hypothetical protein